MRNVSLFTVTAVSTAAICTAMHLVAADGKLLATSSQPVVVSGAEVTGILEMRAGAGVYGVISVTNRSEARAVGTLNHATFNTPGSSLLSRMPALPKQMHSGELGFDLGPGESTNLEFCVQEPAATDSQEQGKQSEPSLVRISPPQWSLLISRGAITQPAFGGSLTMPQGSIVLPEEGVLVLAHTAAAADTSILPAEGLKR